MADPEVSQLLLEIKALQEKLATLQAENNLLKWQLAEQY
jgi:cell division protein FtsB